MYKCWNCGAIKLVPTGLCSKCGRFQTNKKLKTMKNWCIVLFDCDGEIILSQELPDTTTLNEVSDIITSDERVCDWECWPIAEELSPLEP